MFFKKTIRKWGYSFGGQSLKVDENLPKFDTALRLKTADWLLKENDNLKDVYGFSIIADDLAHILDTVGPPKKAITGVPYYIILANPEYARDFQYIPCDVPDRADLIKDDDEEEGNDAEQSDIVSLILNLAYIPDYIADKFTFQSGFSLTLKRTIDEYRMGQGLLKKAVNDLSQ